ncbi:hypothetical protein [Gorillibacterium sp. CAU 1737]|uniref:hypothetical protein n=1 Tax=Gorillibacterium sp. CAU 1737 TaxID=3140362 RepID=UPI0032604D5D
MVKIEITNTNQAEKLIESQKRTFGELLSCKMEEMAISPEKLAEKVSWNKQNKDDIDPRNISYYKRGRKPKKKGRIEALAEALGIPHYELLPDHALANGEADELPDSAYYWMVCIEELREKVRSLSAEQATMLCTSYHELLSIPVEVIDLSAMYRLLDEESQAQFLTYLRVLQDEPNSMSFTKYDVVFDRLERISNGPNDGIMDSWDLFQLLKSTFPNKENTEEAETFSMYLLLLNKDLRDIAKGYLSLDSDRKREMILRIADQMLTTQFHVQ